MSSIARQLYIISDLHIGGRYPDGADPATGQWPDRNQRGFRICTRVHEMARFVSSLAARPASDPEIELVINGDFIDFLAEEWDGDERWQPFVADPDQAAERMAVIIERDRVLFDALAELLANGHRLTILLGNHDVELSFPRVRQQLERAIGLTSGGRFQFIYDGQAYVIGDAIIEHGNRYDGFNVIDHDGLRRVRSYQSRREPVKSQHDYRRPPGSVLVAEVMNHLKEQYPFIDLIKPETQVAIPILLALVPRVYSVLQRLGLIKEAAGLAKEAAAHAPGDDSQPSYAGDISDASAGDGFDDEFGGDMGMDMGMDTGTGDIATNQALDPNLRGVLAGQLGDDQADALFSAIVEEYADEASGDLEPMAGEPMAGGPMDGDIDTDGDISAGDWIKGKLSFAKLVFARKSKPLHTRIGSLHAALNAVQGDLSFSREVETKSEYLNAAEHLIGRGFKVVVFGHTHLAKRIEVGGGVYLNSGTWADLIRFPQAILERDAASAQAELESFVTDLEERRFAQYVQFIPTYVRLDMSADEQVLEAALCDYDIEP